MPTLWSGRFDDASDTRMRELGDSLAFDVTMFREDIEASRAHTEMLARVGILTEIERNDIFAALTAVETEIASGEFVLAPSDEDIHTAVERRVTEMTPAGGKMHTARSRNDQVSTDLRLWTRAAVGRTLEQVAALQQSLLTQAEGIGANLMPGYTHLQRAQPVAIGHCLLAHGWALARDVDRLNDALKRINISPLGAGAIAGTSLEIDIQFTSERLGFDSVFDNSIDAVGDRDFVAETLSALAILGVHLSRIGEDFVLWASSEFSFIRISDKFSTGSSMMPQKRNPDAAELARGKAGRLIGNLTGLLATLKGLPTGYSKDLQEDKEPLFDSFRTVGLTLDALTGMVETTKFDLERMREAAADQLLGATDLAEWLVAKGVPFRQAHSLVAKLVKQSVAGEKDLATLVSESTELGPEAARLVGDQLGEGRISHGGGSPGALDSEIERFKSRLQEHEELRN